MRFSKFFRRRVRGNVGSKADTLRHNYHELSDLDRAIYRAKIRPTWDERRRFFFEGDPNLIGQMYAAERQALFEAVVRRRPRKCFEIGTWSGGGSTYFIASAFKQIGAGELITVEADAGMHDLAKTYYSSCHPDLAVHVNFIHGNDVGVLAPHIGSDVGVECFFLDGSDDRNESVRQFKFFETRSRPGTIMMAHDWNDVKQARLRPLIEADARWRPLVTLGPPESVGFVVYEFSPG